MKTTNALTVLQIILTTISAGTGPNVYWSVPAIFSPYMYKFWLSKKKNYESLYLYFKLVTLLLSSCTVWSPINQNGNSNVPMHVGKNTKTGMIVLFPSVNTLRFQSWGIPTFSFYIDCYQTEEWVSALILFWKHLFFKVRGCNYWFCLFVWFDSLRLLNNLSVMRDGLPGLNQY